MDAEEQMEPALDRNQSSIFNNFCFIYACFYNSQRRGRRRGVTLRLLLQLPPGPEESPPREGRPRIEPERFRDVRLVVRGRDVVDTVSAREHRLVPRRRDVFVQPFSEAAPAAFPRRAPHIDWIF